MKKAAITATILVTITASSASASAAPGAALLTLGGLEGRHATTPGVTFEHVHDVHLYRGTPALLGGDDAPAPPAGAMINAHASPVSPCRTQTQTHPRRQMRTQGFYTGKVYPSRRYTKGFFSGR